MNKLKSAATTLRHYDDGNGSGGDRERQGEFPMSGEEFPTGN